MNILIIFKKKFKFLVSADRKSSKKTKKCGPSLFGAGNDSGLGVSIVEDVGGEKLDRFVILFYVSVL